MPERRTPKGRWIALVAVSVLCGCRTPHDYSAYLEHMPRSILVLPPLNNSVEPAAPYIYISTVTRPLAERGYYVFPVAVIDLMMKENGLPTPGEMHQVSLAKIDEILGADAVLYVTIEEWGTEYHIISSTTKVRILATLVDVKTGKTLWSGRHAAVHGSGGGDPAADLEEDCEWKNGGYAHCTVLDCDPDGVCIVYGEYCVDEYGNVTACP